MELQVLSVATPDATEATELQPIAGTEHVLSKQNKWTRHGIRHIELALLTEPQDGCTHMLVINGEAGFLYRDPAIAQEDFDAILTGAEPVILRNDL
jgi:hypothetical protein